MSEQYLSHDGFKPLPLPVRGEELTSGRQYYLDAIARKTVEEVYGLRGLPAVIECIHPKREATQIISFTKIVRTGRIGKKSVVDLPAQDATFRAFQGGKVWHRFTIDLERVQELRPYYAEAHKVSDEEKRVVLIKAAKPRKAPDLSILDI